MQLEQLSLLDLPPAPQIDGELQGAEWVPPVRFGEISQRTYNKLRDQEIGVGSKLRALSFKELQAISDSLGGIPGENDFLLDTPDNSKEFRSKRSAPTDRLIAMLQAHPYQAAVKDIFAYLTGYIREPELSQRITRFHAQAEIAAIKAAESPVPTPKPAPQADPWVCDACGLMFSKEVDLLAHQFNSECEKDLAKPEPPCPKFAPGDVVLVRRLYPDNSREREADFYWAGSVVGYNAVGMVLVNIGAGEPYACPEERLTKYDGVVSLWRLGQAVICDRPDCHPHQSARPFTCQQCEARSTPWWWYVGEMSIETRTPRWPDAVWFPAGYDPNTRTFGK